MKKILFNLTFVFLILSFISPNHYSKIKDNKSSNSIIKDYQKNFKEAQDKILMLAEAIPQKDYSWRPSKGVRSVSESLVHVAVANLFILKYLGFKTKEKVSFNMEKEVTKKADIIALLKKSSKFVKESFDKVDVKQFDNMVEIFNKQKSTKRGVMLLIVTHNHEHLGQLIAYARSIGVVPPWSRKNK